MRAKTQHNRFRTHGSIEPIQALLLPALRDQKYCNIVREIIKEQFQAKLAGWLEKISESEKKGLRVIKAVIDIKGAKRFKNKNTDVENKNDILDLKLMTTE